MKENRDFYKILIPGASGKGKTYMFRTMDPNTTGFINVENKPLPFKNNFKYHKRITLGSKEALDTLVEYAKNPEITSIVFDSFSAYMDLVLSESKAAKKGFVQSGSFKISLIAGTFVNIYLPNYYSDIIVA